MKTIKTSFTRRKIGNVRGHRTAGENEEKKTTIPPHVRWQKELECSKGKPGAKTDGGVV